jgi:hypothetical protein
MLPATNAVPRKPPPNLQLLCDVLREGLCVDVQMSTLLKACTASCDSAAKMELSCTSPDQNNTTGRTCLSQSFAWSLFICCLLVDQSLHISGRNSVTRVIVRHNTMCVFFLGRTICPTHILFSCAVFCIENGCS